ncbi:esterase family protein [Penicillium mononematosum]|uniref:esterase family protein n=1 Tax=Penicillium mononematosum TaxID=268346 RepID=UPI0025479DFC|nr:esterase family protein [Penicillium mononematosum]KAJ6190877.1 esterase family protein [Penicillium mononematosum]
MSEPPDPVSSTTSQHSTPASLLSTPGSFPQSKASRMFYRRTGRHPGVQEQQSAPAYAKSYTWIAPRPILLTEQSGSSQSLSSPKPISNCPIQDARKDRGSLESSFRVQILANKRRGENPDPYQNLLCFMSKTIAAGPNGPMAWSYGNATEAVPKGERNTVAGLLRF